MYEKCMVEIDAIDNGVNQIDSGEVKLNYSINSGLSKRVSLFNMPWWAEDPDADNNEDFTCPNSEGFRRAMLICEEHIIHSLYDHVFNFLPAREIVERSFEDRRKFHESGALLLLDRSCPWKSHLSAIEEERGQSGEVLFVMYRD